MIDTNVGVVANLNAGVSDECALECVRVLRAITQRGHLVLDAGDLIFDEYRRHMKLSGEPGTGDAFMRWVHDHRFNPEFCTRVPIRPTVDGSFEEFPDAEGLATLDRSDRKFVCVALAHPELPAIVVATDRGWPKHATALAALGVTVRLLNEPQSV